MNKFLITLIIICNFISIGNAQNLISKVPASASAIIKYSGENFSKNLPVKKIDSYEFVKENIFKLFKVDTLTSLQNLGVNLEKDTYQYITTQDSCTSFITLLNLSNTAQFLKMIDANYHSEMKPLKKEGYNFLALADNTFLGWNEQEAIFVITTYQNPNKYYYQDVTVDSVMTVATDSATTVPSILDKVKEKKKPITKQTTKNKKKLTTPIKKGKKPITKKTVKKKKPVEKEETTITETAIVMNHEDSVAQEKRDAWYKEKDKITTARQRKSGDSIIASSFNTKIESIQNNSSYKKVVDPAAHVSVWYDQENILRQYWSGIFGGNGYYPVNNYFGSSLNNTDILAGSKTGINIYFDKDKMRMEEKTFSPNEEVTRSAKAVYNSKQSNALAGYVNPDNIGYVSLSLNTEAMMNNTYAVMKNYLKNSQYISEYSDVANVYIDLLEIIIDEKAIAELTPGNFMFVLHSIKSKKVTYTDYTYDEEFKSKEVKKTKDELSPDFTFIMETKKENFMQRVLALPLKYTKKGDYDYKDKGGYYELVFDTGKYAIAGLYFMEKDGKVIITTSKEIIDMTMAGKSYNIDADTKASILNNNYAMKINSQTLLEQLRLNVNTKTNRDICRYLEDNMGDIKIENGLKNGEIQGTTIMNIKGNHSNSLAFFFDMADAINKIMKTEKEEKEKKLD